MIDFSAEPWGPNGDVLVIRLSGNLDTETCDYFFTCLEDEIERGHTKMIIDCRDLEFVSSLGLGMLLRAHARLKKHGGNVKLARVGGAVADLLRMVKLGTILHVYPRVRDAYHSFPEEND